MIGAREGAFTAFRRVLARAMGAHPRVIVVPGRDVAVARGLDLIAAGLEPVASPRHANVLLIVGPLHPQLADAAATLYAQMPRPRAIVALEAENLTPLPPAAVVCALSQEGLREATQALPEVFAKGAFSETVKDFDAPALAVRVEYTCPMHPEVVSDEPGNCPKCGMTLVPKEAAAAGAHDGHGEKKDHGANAAHEGHHGHGHQHGRKEHGGHEAHSGHETHGQASEAATYTCPMHPEIVRNEPGQCPICGMTLISSDSADAPGGHHGAHPEMGSDGGTGHGAHAKMDHSAHGKMDHSNHGGMDHSAHGAGTDVPGIEPNFMSMVEMTKDLPASGDGLRMEWIDVPFGPFHPGLPGGLTLTLSLDGDTVAGATLHGLARAAELQAMLPATLDDLRRALKGLSPHNAGFYVALLDRAVLAALGETTDLTVESAAIARLRLLGDLRWIAGLARLKGAIDLAAQAEGLHRSLLTGHGEEIRAQLAQLCAKLQRAPAFRPIFSARGGPGPAPAERLARMAQDIATFADRAPAETAAPAQDMAGTGEAVVETGRGAARLKLTIKAGLVTDLQLVTPSQALAGHVAHITMHKELGEALAAVCLLDLDPWEVAQ